MSRPRLVWLTADINDWIESRRTFRPDTELAELPRKRERQPAEAQKTADPRRRGRPTKTEQARRAAQVAGEGGAQ